MNITPLEIRKMEFKKSMRGLDSGEVQNFLEMVADRMEDVLRESMSVKEQLRLLESKIEEYRNLEATLQSTMTTAQTNSIQVKKNAEQEAELIIQAAKVQAETILEKARNETNRITTEISSLETYRRTINAQLKGFLYGQIKALEEGEIAYKKIDIDETKNLIRRKIKKTTPSLDNLFED